jgi:ferritin-like metal-binding protein YciE
MEFFMDLKQTYISWLNNAYAMEESVAEALEQQASVIKGNKEIDEKIKEHIHDTKEQSKRIKKLIESAGGEISDMKKVFGETMSMIKEKLIGTQEDKLVKFMSANYATEHLEIATYTSLIVAADQVEDEDAIEILEQSLDEEEQMADWIEERLPQLTQDYLESL